jgi:hypothetical protein
MGVEDRTEKERIKINNYEQTVDAILAFAGLIVHDGKAQRPNSEFGLGRRMTTSPQNPSPSSEVHPDLVAQKSNKYGIVTEVKKSLDQNPSHWTKELIQLRKYDDDLTGWWTKKQKISLSDAAMLIHQTIGKPFRDYLEEQKNKGPNSVGPNTCVVEFNPSPGVHPFYFFRLEYGDLQDNELKQRLYNGINVPLETIKESFIEIQYYDARPPASLILIRLWSDYFNSKAAEEGEYDEKTKSYKIAVMVSDVTDELQKGYGSQRLKQDKRSGEFPKQKWIREALDKLVEYKLATPGNKNGEYIIHFRWFRGDILEKFVKFEINKQKKGRPAQKQIPLFKNKSSYLM